MSDVEKIARWLERLHCSRIDEDEVCYKSNCQLFHSLAQEIREKFA